jgi:hypothetical protein
VAGGAAGSHHNAGDPGSRPVVVVGHRGEAAPEGALREICAGITEEGVPHRVTDFADAADLTALAHAAARTSPLEVGVGVDASGVCVHHAKLPADRPVARSTTVDAATSRRMGHDAARIVTGLPLKLGEPGP